MVRLDAAKKKRLAFFAGLIAAGSFAGAQSVFALIPVPCDVPSVAYPTIASAANDSRCAVINLILPLYSSYLSIPAVYYESGITISHSTTLNGNGSTIDGGNSGRSIFTVDSNFSLNNVHIQHGKAPNGGAINNASILDVENSTFSQNSSTSSDVNNGGGGAIRNFRGSVTIKDSVFDSNHAIFAGAVNNFESHNFILERCTFTHNTASTQGGAVYIDEFSSAQIDGSVFTGNSAGSGGAIFTSGSAKITNSALNRNNATTNGGAITFDASIVNLEVDLTGDTFTGNSSGEGGAIYYAAGADHDPLLTVNNGTFLNNSSTGDGGALWLAYSTTITNSSITKNFAHGSGGGIFDTGIDAALALDHDSLIDNHACVTGGGLDLDSGGSASIGNTTIVGNMVGGPGCF